MVIDDPLFADSAFAGVFAEIDTELEQEFGGVAHSVGLKKELAAEAASPVGWLVYFRSGWVFFDLAWRLVWPGLPCLLRVICHHPRAGGW
jgi:hypothetical protein